MQEFVSPQNIKNEIITTLVEKGFAEDCFVEMLNYTIELFETQGLGADYYGYHNINHELEVTYVALLSANSVNELNKFSLEDLKYLYTSALFHDFDPQKSVDKPHEESVLRFISSDLKVKNLVEKAGLDLEIIKVLILRTTYPWSGKLKEEAERQIKECFRKSQRARDDEKFQEHIMTLGWFLSIVDRVSGYTLGDFSKAMEMAKMNAHALAWQPSLIVRSSVAYFEELLNKETEMSRIVLSSLPNHMRKNFFDTVLSFMSIRQQEISIQANSLYENLKMVPTIEKMSVRKDPNFISALYKIFLELPKPLQFNKDRFEESIRDENVILTSLRLNSSDGEIIGFAKGGPLESYSLRPEIRDENYGLFNTVFLEPLALKMGYWGLKGGSEMRHMFILQAHSKKFKNLTSFALREVVKARVNKENAEFVTKFDPERWDYYRIKI